MRGLTQWRRAICESNLPATSRLVAFAISFYAPGKFPGLFHLAKDVNLDKATVSRHLNRLVEDEWLIRDRNVGRGNSSVYEINLPKMSHQRDILVDGNCRKTVALGRQFSKSEKAHSINHIKDNNNTRGISEQIAEIFSYWQTCTNRPNTILTSQRIAKIKSRLKTFSVQQLKQAIFAASRDPFYSGNNERNKRYDWIETILRSDERVEQFLEKANNNGKRAQPKSQKQAESYEPINSERISSTIGELFGENFKQRDDVLGERDNIH